MKLSNSITTSLLFNQIAFTMNIREIPEDRILIKPTKIETDSSHQVAATLNIHKNYNTNSIVCTYDDCPLAYRVYVKPISLEKQKCNKNKNLENMFTFCEYFAIVENTVKALNGSRVETVMTERYKEILKYIYSASLRLDYTRQDLIIFTAFALHNMYLLQRIICPNYHNSEIGHTSRGLLQFLSLSDYEKLNSVKLSVKCDYVKCPFLLEELTKESIMDEMNAFLSFYNIKLEPKMTPLYQFIKAVHKLSPTDTYLITKQNAELVMKNEFEANEEVEFMAQNRFRVFFALMKFYQISEDNKKPTD